MASAWHAVCGFWSYGRTRRLTRRIADPSTTKKVIAVSAYLYIALLAVPSEIEDEFNHLYDTGYVPNLLKVPGVESGVRYRLEWSDNEDMPEYLAVYEVDSPDVPHSPEWKNASIECGWAERIRPHLKVRRHGMFRRLPAL
jgi:hypothetical protein